MNIIHLHGIPTYTYYLQASKVNQCRFIKLITLYVNMYYNHLDITVLNIVPSVDDVINVVV